MQIKMFVRALKADPNREKRMKSLSLDSAGLTRYLAYLDSPWKIIFTNFISGIAYGFGFLIGVAVVLGLLGILVRQFLAQIPLVGQSIEVFYNWLQTQIETYKSVN